MVCVTGVTVTTEEVKWWFLTFFQEELYTKFTTFFKRKSIFSTYIYLDVQTFCLCFILLHLKKNKWFIISVLLFAYYSSYKIIDIIKCILLCETLLSLELTYRLYNILLFFIFINFNFFSRRGGGLGRGGGVGVGGGGWGQPKLQS